MEVWRSGRYDDYDDEDDEDRGKYGTTGEIEFRLVDGAAVLKKKVSLG